MTGSVGLFVAWSFGMFFAGALTMLITVAVYLARKD